MLRKELVPTEGDMGKSNRMIACSMDMNSGHMNWMNWMLLWTDCVPGVILEAYCDGAGSGGALGRW